MSWTRDVIRAPYKESRHEWRWSVLVHYFQWQGICDHVGNSWRHFSDFLSQSQIALAKFCRMATSPHQGYAIESKAINTLWRVFEDCIVFRKKTQRRRLNHEWKIRSPIASNHHVLLETVYEGGRVCCVKILHCTCHFAPWSPCGIWLNQGKGTGFPVVSAFDLRTRSIPLLSTPYTFLQCSLIAVITVTCGFDNVKGLMGHFVWIISLVCMHL